MMGGVYRQQRADLSVEGVHIEVKGMSSLSTNKVANNINEAFEQVNADNYRYPKESHRKGAVVILSKYSDIKIAYKTVFGGYRKTKSKGFVEAEDSNAMMSTIGKSGVNAAVSLASTLIKGLIKSTGKVAATIGIPMLPMTILFVPIIFITLCMAGFAGDTSSTADIDTSSDTDATMTDAIVTMTDVENGIGTSHCVMNMVYPLTA